MPEKKAKKAKPEASPEVDAMSTQERILGAALEVFAEKGLHGATMVEIAKRAGLTGGALYRYFDSKEDVFRAVVEKHSFAFSALEMIRDLIPELQPGTALKFIAQGMLLFFYSEVDFMRVVVSESLKDPELSMPFFEKMLAPSREFLKGCLDLWKEKGLIREDIDTNTATVAFLGMVGYLMIEQAFFGGGGAVAGDASELAEQFSSIFLEGVLKD